MYTSQVTDQQSPPSSFLPSDSTNVTHTPTPPCTPHKSSTINLYHRASYPRIPPMTYIHRHRHVHLTSHRPTISTIELPTLGCHQRNDTAMYTSQVTDQQPLSSSFLPSDVTNVTHTPTPPCTPHKSPTNNLHHRASYPRVSPT